MRILSLVLISAMLVLSSCSSISVKTDYDHEVDFKQYKSYSWFKGKIEGDDALARNPLVKNRVIFSIDKAMLAKKIKIKAEEDADLVVAVYAGTKERMQVTNYGGYGGYGYGRRGGWGHGGYTTTDVNYYNEANLIIDFFDSKEKVLVWRGIATGILKESKDQDEQQKRLDDVVTKILNEYPPK